MSVCVRRLLFYGHFHRNFICRSIRVSNCYFTFDNITWFLIRWNLDSSFTCIFVYGDIRTVFNLVFSTIWDLFASLIFGFECDTIAWLTCCRWILWLVVLVIWCLLRCNCHLHWNLILRSVWISDFYNTFFFTWCSCIWLFLPSVS